MTLKFFPPIFLRAESTPPAKLVGASKSAGRSASNVMINSRSDGGGLWSFQRSGIPIRTADELRFWNAMQAYLTGGATPMIVPICESRTAPWPTVDGVKVTSLGSVPFDDETFFSDGTGFETPVIAATLLEAVALRATTFTVRILTNTALRGGELFSVEHLTLSHRPYRITGLETLSSTDYSVTVEPPFREAADAGVDTDFDLPKCVMQLDTMDIPLEVARYAKASISFVESFLPLS